MPTAADLLDHYPPPIRALTEDLRTLVKQTVPDAKESVRLGWQSLGYAAPKAGYFFGLFPKHDCVLALFEWGVLLPDPDHVLEGSGTQVRYITVRQVDAATEAALRTLIAAALSLPAGRDAKLAMLAGRTGDGR